MARLIGYIHTCEMYMDIEIVSGIHQSHDFAFIYVLVCTIIYTLCVFSLSLCNCHGFGFSFMLGLSSTELRRFVPQIYLMPFNSMY